MLATVATVKQLRQHKHLNVQKGCFLPEFFSAQPAAQSAKLEQVHRDNSPGFFSLTAVREISET